jgi:hypothetical protein
MTHHLNKGLYLKILYHKSHVLITGQCLKNITLYQFGVSNKHIMAHLKG